MSNHQTLSYQPSDVLQAEYALNWWNCYVNPNNTKDVPWLTTLSWVDFYENERKQGFTREGYRGMPAPDFKYFTNLMKLIPIGIADGSLQDIFPSNRSLELWLIRSVGAEQLAIQQGIATKSEFQTYLKQSKVKQNGRGIAEQVLDMARTSPALAKAAITQLKKGEAVTGIVAQPAMRRMVDSGARVNQLQQAMDPVAIDDTLALAERLQRGYMGDDSNEKRPTNVVAPFIAFSVSAFVMFAILTR